MCRVKKKPAETCDICKKQIELYRPWYTIDIKQCLGPFRALQTREYGVFCKECFQKYRNFINEKQVESNHEQNYQEMMNGK